MKYRFIHIIVLVLLMMVFNSALFATDYQPFSIQISGNLKDLATKSPLKKTTGYASIKTMSDLDEPNLDFCEAFETDKTGRFNFELYVDANKPEFCIKIKDAAQIRFKNVPIDSAHIDLGNVYIVFYDNELNEEHYNLPVSALKNKAKKSQRNERLQKRFKHYVYRVSEVVQLFSKLPLNYNMTLNPVDTVGPIITRLNFGPEKSRGTIIQNYIQIDFTRDFSKKRNEGLTEIVSYNQRALYIKHHIDSLLIKKFKVVDQDSIYTGRINKYLNDSGYVVREVQYCANGQIMQERLNDSIGRELMSTVLNYACDGSLLGFVKTIQGPYGPKKREVFFHDSLLASTQYWEYDLLGREVKHENHGFFEQPWSEYTNYFDENDSSVTVKVKEYGDTLEKTHINYGSKGEYARFVYMSDSLVSKTFTSYNAYGNIYNVNHYGNDSEVPISQQYFYYKKPFKLTTEKTVLYGEHKTTNWLKYEYYETGFIEKESWHNDSKSQLLLGMYEYH